MKCWNPVFNAQGSRLTLVIVRVGEVEIYVAETEALRKKERQDETHSLPPKLMVFWISLNANVLICSFFKSLTCVWPNSGFWCCVFITLLITLLFYWPNGSCERTSETFPLSIRERAGPKKVMLFDSIQIWHPMLPSLPRT
jgi:cell division protein FtsW (lipid II flippase)